MELVVPLACLIRGLFAFNIGHEVHRLDSTGHAVWFTLGSWPLAVWKPLVLAPLNPLLGLNRSHPARRGAAGPSSPPSAALRGHGALRPPAIRRVVRRRAARTRVNYFGQGAHLAGRGSAANPFFPRPGGGLRYACSRCRCSPPSSPARRSSPGLLLVRRPSSSVTSPAGAAHESTARPDFPALVNMALGHRHRLGSNGPRLPPPGIAVTAVMSPAGLYW